MPFERGVRIHSNAASLRRRKGFGTSHNGIHRMTGMPGDARALQDGNTRRRRGKSAKKLPLSRVITPSPCFNDRHLGGPAALLHYAVHWHRRAEPERPMDGDLIGARPSNFFPPFLIPRHSKRPVES